jgi:hypothetical protein
VYFFSLIFSFVVVKMIPKGRLKEIKLNVPPPNSPLTPSLELRRLDADISIHEKEIQHRIARDEEDSQNIWTSCCVKLDRRAVQFFSGLAVSLIILGMAIVKILTNNDGSGVYLNLVILILGIFSPSPQLTGKK